MNKNLTEIIFLLDRSGSMQGLEQDTIGGFNGFLKSQCKLGETILTTVLFDDKYEILHNGVDAKNISLTDKQYYTRGMTALLDALGKTILDVGTRLSKTAGPLRPGKVIFVITTDGMENASREFTYEKINEMIKHQKEKYNWEFIFMGANIDVKAEGEKLGIDEERAVCYQPTEAGTAEMYDDVCKMVCEIRAEI